MVFKCYVQYSRTVDKYLVWNIDRKPKQHDSEFSGLAKAVGAESCLRRSKTSALYTLYFLPIPQILFL